MIIISDTSCISYLLQIDQIDLLFKLYGKVIIPEIVFQELGVIPGHAADVADLMHHNFIGVQSLNDFSILSTLSGSNLDAGEKQAIAPAIELNADLLLMDEALGRVVAKKSGVTIRGILSVFPEAKANGLIKLVEPLLIALRNKTSFYFSDSVYKMVVTNAGE